jgi:hypothetical protein
MNKVIKLDHIPEKFLILNGFDRIDYCDTYKIEISPGSRSIDKITTDILMTPLWVDNLMKLRDNMVKRFGLRATQKNEVIPESHYSIGSKAVFFTVIDRDEYEIVMAENDKHLNFKTSVRVENGSSNSFVYLSTIVQFNNFFGRLYFLPVKPFHRAIMKSLLRNYSNEN